MKKILIKFIPNWQSLVNIGNNKIVKSSYIWIFIIPIIAKTLEKVPEKVFIPFTNAEIEIILTLPFSWNLLYFSALIFALATVLFAYKSPELVNKFSDVNEYKEKGLGKEQLITFFSSWLRKETKVYQASGENIEIEKLILDFYKKYANELSNDKLNTLNNTEIDINKRIRMITIKDDEFSNAFWFLRSLMANDNLIFRTIITILYIFGFLMLFKILIDNISVVIYMM